MMDFSDSEINSLASALNNIEEPFSAELEESAASVTGSLKNVLQSAPGTSQVNGDSELNQTYAKV